MILRWLATAIATLGVGKIPWAPGTWGSLVALLVWWAIMPSDFLIRIASIVFAFFLGWIATKYYERFYDKHDPKEVVVDELVGMWIPLLLLPSAENATGEARLYYAALGFLLFRLFDIWKPFPIGWIDRKVPGALGTMLDDVVAGLAAYALLFVFLLMRF